MSRKKLLTRTLSLIIACLFVLGCITPISSTNLYVSAADGVKAKLDAFMQSYPNGSRWTGSFDGGIQCYGFAKLVVYNIFGASTVSGKTYRSWTYAGVSTSGMTVVSSITSFSSSNVQNLLAKAKCGDVLQFNTASQHSMIVYSVESDGVWIYDCNWDGNCGIRLKKCSFGSWSGRNSSKLTLLRSDNYASVDGTPVDTSLPAKPIVSCPTKAVIGETFTINHYSSGPVNEYWVGIYQGSTLVKDYKTTSGTSQVSLNTGGEHSIVVAAINGYGESKSTTSIKIVNSINFVLWVSEKGYGYQWYESPEITQGSTQKQYYFWYRIFDPSDNELIDSFYGGSYDATMEVYTSSGSLVFSQKYTNSDNNWIGIYLQDADTYTFKVTITGERLNGSQTKSFTVSNQVSTISSNSSYNATISSGGEIKYYSFTPTTSGKYVIYSTGAEDTKVYLYNSSLTEITNDDDSGDSTNFHLEYTLNAGTQYIFGVKYYSSSKTGTIPFTFGKVYTINYNANGGSGAPTAQSKDYAQNINLSNTIPKRSGYTFKGWSTSSSATTATYQPNSTFSTNSNTTLYAVWQANSYTVTFKDWDGTTLKTQTVNYGSAASAPANPSRTGYTFTGWDKTFSNITANTTVTAKYSINSYTVTFKDWNGTTLKTQTVNHGSAASAPANPSRTGYTFTGWDKAFSNITANTTVTAKYSINSYTVTFKDWNGTTLKTQTVNYGSAASAPANPSRTGYTFTGWDKTFSNITANTTVTAKYSINSYTVTFKDWDGTTLKTQTVNHGSAASAPANPSRTGYTFTGWDKAFSNITNNLTVTATYTKKNENYPTYTVTLTDNNDGTATITATVPSGIASGKLVIDVSDKLTFISGSLCSVSGAMVNESYYGGKLCISFAGIYALPTGTTVFTAKFNVQNGSTLSSNDFTAPEWNLTDGTVKLASNADGDVIKRYEKKTYTLGDVNNDGSIDNLDSAFVLKLDAGIIGSDTISLLAADVNGDDSVDNLDAAWLLKYDAGIISKF